MSMGGGEPPPDYQALARQQAESQAQLLQQQTVANRPNQTTPFGTSRWEQDPTTGQWSQTQDVAPQLRGALQNQFGIQSGLLRTARGMLPEIAEQSSFDPWGAGGGLTAWGNTPQASDEARQRAEQGVYGQATSRLDPQWAQASEAKRNQLYSLGLKEGNPLFDKEMENLQRSKADAYNQALFSSIGAGQQAYGQSFQQALQAAQQANAQRQAQVGEAGTRATFGTNVLQNLIRGQGVGQGQFGTVPQAGMAQAPDLLGAAGQAYQAEQARNANQQAMLGNMVGGAGTLTLGAMMLSDETTKEFSGEDVTKDIEELLSAGEGRAYSYDREHKDFAGKGEYVTPTAQSLERTKLGKDLVTETPVGKMVDYGKGFGTMMASISHVNKKINRLIQAMEPAPARLL